MRYVDPPLPPVRLGVSNDLLGASTAAAPAATTRAIEVGVAAGSRAGSYIECGAEVRFLALAQEHLAGSLRSRSAAGAVGVVRVVRSAWLLATVLDG